jgi:hypothetical protein
MMTSTEISAICVAPVAVTLIYVIHLILKEPNENDEFFHLSAHTDKESIIRRIQLLEKLNNKDYSRDIKEIERFYSDGRITPREEEKIEKIITNSYFNQFEKRWSAYRMADPVMKAIFVFMLCYGFVFVTLVFTSIVAANKYPIDATPYLLIANLSLILPYLFSLTLLGFFNMILAMCNLKFSNRGGLNRACLTAEELVRSLKPGGRKTEIVLGKAWSRSTFSP